VRVGLIGTGRIGVLHAGTLIRSAAVSELVVADADAARAARAAEATGASLATVDELFAGRADAIVIAATSAAHTPLLLRGADAGLPMFCEKPLAADLAGTRAVVERLAAAGVPVQVGFQRRFDAGYRAARDAVRAGELGRLHTLRAVTADPAPPDPAYIPGSGGIFRDCNIHDFDAIRFVTGREVASVWATGANQGAAFFAEAGDVDTAASVLALDDGTLALVSASRYNGGGYDVRLELAGTAGSLAVGLDARAPLRSAERGVDWPGEPPYSDFYDRFGPAYAAELEAFVALAAGRAPNACPPEDALEALHVAEAAQRSRDEGRAVAVKEIRATQTVAS
jgi:myo-inositol 2-dehydrogenase/D-chiro-inositol 1-dehydrogenase